MTSKIINMAERLMDAEDRQLEALFKPEPIADDGFSQRVVGRIRRRIWIRRLALPIAMFIGAAIALKPATELVVVVSKLMTIVPQEVIDAPAGLLPRVEGAITSGPIVPMVLYGLVLLGLGLAGTRKLV